jgi:hypothetical protein
MQCEGCGCSMSRVDAAVLEPAESRRRIPAAGPNAVAFLRPLANNLWAIIIEGHFKVVSSLQSVQKTSLRLPTAAPKAERAEV